MKGLKYDGCRRLAMAVDNGSVEEYDMIHL